MNQQQILHSPFNLEIHKKEFIDYLEVIIDENGTIMYAVPSHQEKLISIACDKLKITRDELIKRCPVEYYFDVMTWLCQVSDCVALWTSRMEGKANKKQEETIEKLIEEDLYIGRIFVQENSKVISLLK
ncbi:hypothetical protein [Bacillus cereus group sp. TH152-1LC]|uniref:hypothetical protein n=1 Tax=Bacillus cereus group sp. TH152-1LC TaxID=3018060 RepID=UPI0022E8ABC6|nr:hypothetical protein [Bacillus cereus group sp. TH152-1LC]MDA1675337.1 hypothetical protein [Bacillus cereus group sp. TH152-1LC]